MNFSAKAAKKSLVQIQTQQSNISRKAVMAFSVS